jgi:hypothetical protein
MSKRWIYGILNGQLWEFNTQELRAAIEEHKEALRVVDWSRAHKWVRDGLTHNTGLYMGFDGRVRRALGEYE